MRKVLLLIIINLLGLAVYINGQSYPESLEDFNEGQFFFNRGEYQDAVFFYLKLVNYDSLNANFNFKVGECYLNIPGKEHLAIPYFERSLKNLVPKKKYNKRDFNERNAPLHACFYLGNAYRMAGQLNKALDCYSKFLDSPYFWGNYNQDIVEQEIKSCERAKIIQDAPLEIEKINLGPNINTGFTEELPVISGDGNTLVFMRNLKFYDAVFYSTKNTDGWKEAININPQILSDGEFYPTGLSSDGRQLLLIKKEDDSREIYISYLQGDTWTKAVPLGNKINSNSNASFASFGPDCKSIYLSSVHSGSKNGYDIFVSYLSSKGEWGRPKNIGKPINTDFDEQNPIVCNKGQVLFFCSKGHYNMGGYDIFYSNFVNGIWSLPVNIGYPINDTRDNFLYYPTEECKSGYIALNDSTGFGLSDIYYIKIKSNSVLNFQKDIDDK
jgi:tetratricopeptide (TPR) repeat protein